MAWQWILKRLASGTREGGLWDYLSRRHDNRTRMELERVHADGSKEIIDHLTPGSIFRDETATGRREIRKGPAPGTSLLFVSHEPGEPAADSAEPTKLPPPSEALDQGDGPPALQPPE
jgi:hypothetical protein